MSKFTKILFTVGATLLFFYAFVLVCLYVSGGI